MKKAPMAVALVLVFGLFAAAFSLAPAIAQDYASNSTGTGSMASDNSTSTAGTGNATGDDNQTSTAAEGSTFSASGRIAAIIYDTPESTSTETTSDTGSNMSSSSNMTSDGAMSTDNTTMSQVMTGANDTSTSGNMTSSNTTGSSTSGMNDTSTAQQDETELPYIVSGDWSLDVQDGNVSDFTANFTMVHTDGTGRHIHDVSNFQASNGSTVQLEEDGVTFIFGTSDVMTNGSSAWTAVDTLIVIENGNAASITLSTEDDHFKGQPLYGIVDSLTDESGNEMIQTTETAQEGNATGIGDLGNQTGDFLGDIGESFQNMTGIGQ